MDQESITAIAREAVAQCGNHYGGMVSQGLRTNELDDYEVCVFFNCIGEFSLFFNWREVRSPSFAKFLYYTLMKEIKSFLYYEKNKGNNQ